MAQLHDAGTRVPIRWRRRRCSSSSSTPSSKKLFGLPLEHRSRATTLIRDRKRGIFGTPVAAFGVSEEQLRKTLHAHFLLWGGVSPRLLQLIAGDPETLAALGAALRAALDSVFSAAVHPAVHVADLARRALRDVRPTRAAYFTGAEAQPPQPQQEAPPPGEEAEGVAHGVSIGGPHTRAAPESSFQIRAQMTALSVGLHKCE